MEYVERVLVMLGSRRKEEEDDDDEGEEHWTSAFSESEK